MSQVLVRRAVAGDAGGISALYAQAYKPENGGEASEHYPFPQLLEPTWVARAISDAWIHWVVAEGSAHIVGSAAAVRNIGSAEDRVAELFGVVVEEKQRGTGIAKRLLAALCEGLGDEPQFILCESRTALQAGWKVARSCGFTPLGFEPFAHRTPAGSEAMLLTGRIQTGAMQARSTETLYAPVRALADAVLGDLRPAEFARATACAYPLRAKVWSDLAPFCHRPVVAPAIEAPAPVSVSRDDERGRDLIERSDAADRHSSGVIAFSRFEGSAAQRYDRQYHVVCAGQSALAAALVVHDKTDQRARILDLRTVCEGLQGVLLAGVVEALSAQEPERRLTLVVDARADALSLQEALIELGFHPTIYYPSFIAQGKTRIDGIQYTRLHNSRFKDSLDCLEELDWFSAQQVIRAVHQGFRSVAGSKGGNHSR